MYYFSLATFQPFKNVKTIIHSPNIEKQAAVFVSWDWGHELVLSPSPTAQFFFGVYLPFSRLRQPTKYVLPLLSLYVSDFFPSLHFFPIGPQIQRDTEEVKEVMSTAWGTGVRPSPAALPPAVIFCKLHNHSKSPFHYLKNGSWYPTTCKHLWRWFRHEQGQ